MKDVLAVTKALADENRTRALLFLREGELCVCQVVELLGLAPSTVSKHLTVLHQAGLVESRKQGRWIYYAWPDKPPRQVREAIRWVVDALEGDRRIVEDARRVKAVRKMDKEKLCARYKRSLGK